jgi:Family of unknown function (DUF5682)
MPLHLLGIRHHGTGSARNVAAALAQLQPDIVLIEAPVEFQGLMSWVGHDDLVPPVAVLGYNEAQPQEATFFPFAHFSPEWQAMLYANTRRIPLRLIDLPLAMTFGLSAQGTQSGATGTEQPVVIRDPLQHLAQIDGFEDADAWWEYRMEQLPAQLTPVEHFEAALMMMEALREANIPSVLDRENIVREAFMREQIRVAQRELYTVIAVVCGAWHAPLLRDPVAQEKSDRSILKNLPKTKTKIGATWIPWTYERLGLKSGYGAGLHAPGWYEHLWAYPGDDGAYWLSKVARIMRQNNIDISPAHVIEALRLANMLASLRKRTMPNLADLNEATVAVMCMGEVAKLELVRRELTVGYVVGKIPPQMPKAPLQADFEARAKACKLVPDYEMRTLELDLRKELDLNRSVLLHQVAVLGLNWGKIQPSSGKGTFKEIWQLGWRPEHSIDLIDRAPWGNTVALAAGKLLLHKAEQESNVAAVAEYLAQAITAALFEVVEILLRRIDALSVAANDLPALMAALPPLFQIQRYGNVRKTDTEAIKTLAEGLLIRVCTGLPNALYGLGADTAQVLANRLRTTDDAVRLIETPPLADYWYQTLTRVANATNTYPSLPGTASRLLFDRQIIDATETARRLGLALSPGQSATFAAAWVEGFLKGSAMVLLHDHTLWNILYDWTARLPNDQFDELLPLLRRTFAHFSPAERRQLGEKARYGIVTPVIKGTDETMGFDEKTGVQVLEAVGAWF